MGFLLGGNSTRSQASFLSKETISSTMKFFQSLLSSESIASLIVMGSLSVIDKEKLAQKSGGFYLSSCLLSQTDLLKIEV
jgi:hypothetical protein